MPAAPARASIPSNKERSMFFQEWRAGVKPHLLNISLRLIIIGGGCSAAAGKRRRCASESCSPPCIFFTYSLPRPLGLNRGASTQSVKQPWWLCTVDHPRTNGPQILPPLPASPTHGGASPRIQTLLTRRWASERNESIVVPDSGTRHWAHRGIHAATFAHSSYLPRFSTHVQESDPLFRRVKPYGLLCAGSKPGSSFSPFF